jgi:hypothetical protein
MIMRVGELRTITKSKVNLLGPISSKICQLCWHPKYMYLLSYDYDYVLLHYYST